MSEKMQNNRQETDITNYLCLSPVFHFPSLFFSPFQANAPKGYINVKNSRRATEVYLTQPHARPVPRVKK